MKQRSYFNTILVLLVVIIFAIGSNNILRAQSPITVPHPDVALSGGSQSGNFAPVWDLTNGDLTLNFQVDLTGMVDDFGGAAHSWSEFGARDGSTALNFNPPAGTGVWLATDYDWTAFTFDPDPPGFPIQDIDDKLLLQKLSGQGEGSYDLPSGPPNPGANHRFWFDRDGVDPWQALNPLAVNGGTYNTNGIYNIAITLHATSATTGTAFMTVNGLNQGFETDGDWTTMELTPAGINFTGDMTHMQVFYGLYGYGAVHSSVFSNISITGYAPSYNEVWVDDDWAGTVPGTEVDAGKFFGFNAFDIIQDGIDVVLTGGTVHVANGTYVLSSTINVDKSLTLTGESEAGVQIDASANGTGYGIKIEADNVTMQYFTILPPIVSGSVGTSGGGGYAIHASFNHTAPYAKYNNLALDHITINNGNRTAFDIHGYNGVTLDDLTATGAAYGNGISITGCSNGVVTNCTTSLNAWGGIAVYVSKPTYLGTGSDNITIDFNINTIGEWIYVEDEFSLVNTNINISAWTYAINNDYSATANYTAYINTTLSDALFFGAVLNLMKFFNMQSVVYDPAGNTYYVGPGMSIQRAIDVANAGDDIIVAAGTYSENVIVNKSLTLLGNPGAILNGTGLGGNGFLVNAPDITIDGFEIKNYNIGIRTYGGPSNFGELDILNVNIHDNTQNGILIVYDYFTQVTLQNSQVSSNGQNGIGIANGAQIDNLSITNTTVSGNGHHGMFLAQATITSLSINNSSFDGCTTNGYSGITMGTTASGIGSFTMTGGSLSGNKGGGLYVVQVASTLGLITLDGVMIQNNTQSGVMLGGGATASSLLIQNCTFQGNWWEDIDLSGGWFGAFTVTGATNITYNSFTGGGVWAAIYIGALGNFGSGIDVNYNSFETGGFGVFNTNALLVNAEENWWGDASGPSGEGPGTGSDAVSANVDFCYWLDDAYPLGKPVHPGDAGEDVTIYYGYPPADPQLNASGGVDYSWSPTDGLSDPNIANPTVSFYGELTDYPKDYTVTVTDMYGCVGTDKVTVTVIDVRCGNNMDKVLVCQVPPENPGNAHTVCVSPNAVPSLLEQGSYLGLCDKSSIIYEDENDPGTFAVNAYPNPFKETCTIEVSITELTSARIQVVDLLGRNVGEIYEGNLDTGVHTFTWENVNIGETNSIYFLQVYTNKETKIIKLMTGQ